DFFLKAEDAFKKLSKEIKHASPEELFCHSELLKRQLLEFTLVEFGTSNVFSNQTLEFHTSPQPSFNKQFDLLIEDLNTNKDKGYINYIACVSEQQAKRFH